MRVAVFFIYLFFMLQGGHANAFAGIDLHNSYYSSTLTIKKAGQVNFINAGQDFASFVNSSLPAEDEYLICQEVEDEDGNDASTRKCKLLVGFYSVPSYQSILNYHYNCARALPLFLAQPSYRYILQRTLRI